PLLANEYISYAIQELRDEAERKKMDTEQREIIRASIRQLEYLKDRIDKDEIKDVKVLEQEFSYASMTIAHDYLIFSQIYFVEDPEAAKGHLSTAINKMEGAAKHLEGESKMEAKEIISESKTLFKKIDDKGAELSKKGASHLVKIEEWLKKHPPTTGFKKVK
ncbi:hypothetical protein N9933_03670, partial [bacterium]|nr:hypothetical protein [bacterium]